MFNIFGYEFTIKKVKKRKKAVGFSAKRWSTSEKNHLLKAHGENTSSTQIAKELNRTVPAVNSMLQKLHKKKS